MKTLSENATEGEKIRFLQEAVIMGQFVHPNIVQLYGIVTDGDPVSTSRDTYMATTQLWRKCKLKLSMTIHEPRLQKVCRRLAIY